MRKIAVALAATMATGLAAAQEALQAAPEAIVASAEAASFTQRSAASPADGVAVSAQPDPLPTSTVPEPGTYAMLAAGLGVVFFVSRRRRRRD